MCFVRNMLIYIHWILIQIHMYMYGLICKFYDYTYMLQNLQIIFPWRNTVCKHVQYIQCTWLNKHMHTCMYTHMNIHIHKHAQTCTHIHTHTINNMVSVSSSNSCGIQQYLSHLHTHPYMNKTIIACNVLYYSWYLLLQTSNTLHHQWALYYY